MNILITGAGGFIGGRLIQYFVNQPLCKVFYISSDFLTIKKQFPAANNIFLNWQSLDSSVDSLVGIDVLIHCAGVNSSDSEKDPKYADYFNHLTTKKLAEVSVKAGITKFIYLSTAHVYASFLNEVISENTIPKNNHPYARSHYLGELALLDIAMNTKMEGIVVRLSNVFGVPVSMNSKVWKLLVNDLCYQVVINNQMVLKTNGMARRDFVSIDEVLKVMHFLISNHLSNDKENIFNLGSGISRSVLEVASLINEINFSMCGIRVPIKRNLADGMIPNDNFRYENMNLGELGIKIIDDMPRVIESILIECYKNISNKK